jgi:hypothetical protein
MLGESGQRTDQAFNKALPKPHRRPFFKDTDIHLVADDGKVSVKAGAYINIRCEDFH